MYCVVANPKRKAMQVYGPYEDGLEAHDALREIGRWPWVQEAVLAEMRQIGDDEPRAWRAVRA